MSIFRVEVDVAATAAYPGTPQVVIPFEPRKITIRYDKATDDVFASFDGNVDHVHLVGTLNGGGDIPYVSDQRVSKVWLRRGATTGAQPVQVIAES